MSYSNCVILYAATPLASADFYSAVLKQAPIESSPSFVMFKLPSGIMLGLWAKESVQPIVEANIGGSELAFSLNSQDEVDVWHTRLMANGATITQTPTHMDFGYTFVVVDPDGHRLRVFTPSAA